MPRVVVVHVTSFHTVPRGSLPYLSTTSCAGHLAEPGRAERPAHNPRAERVGLMRLLGRCAIAALTGQNTTEMTAAMRHGAATTNRKSEPRRAGSCSDDVGPVTGVASWAKGRTAAGCSPKCGDARPI